MVLIARFEQVVSDCSAIALMQDATMGHNYTHNHTDTVRAALVQGGTDADCPVGTNFYSAFLLPALHAGAISTSDIDRAAGRVLRTMFRLGMLDPMADQVFVRYGPADVDNAEARAVALRAAVESIVLLKNRGDLLPLKGLVPLSPPLSEAPLPHTAEDSGLGANGRGGRRVAGQQRLKIAFIGPHANSTQKLMSAPGYHGTTTIVNSYSPLMVAQRKGWDVSYAVGCQICDEQPQRYPNEPCRVNVSAANTSGFAEALAVAHEADVVVLFLVSERALSLNIEQSYRLTDACAPCAVVCWVGCRSDYRGGKF